MKYRKKPIVIEAIQYNGKNFAEIESFVGYEIETVHNYPENQIFLLIETLEGRMLAKKNDWIIKGIKGELYPCKPDIFEQTYEKIEEKKFTTSEELFELLNKCALDNPDLPIEFIKDILISKNSDKSLAEPFEPDKIK